MVDLGIAVGAYSMAGTGRAREAAKGSVVNDWCFRRILVLGRQAFASEKENWSTQYEMEKSKANYVIGQYIDTVKYQCYFLGCYHLWLDICYYHDALRGIVYG